MILLPNNFNMLFQTNVIISQKHDVTCTGFRSNIVSCAIAKLCILIHMVHIGCGSGYISELVSATSALPGRIRLRSSGWHRYEIPAILHKIGERAFSYAGLAAWNSLLTTLTNLTDTQTFRSSLNLKSC